MGDIRDAIWAVGVCLVLAGTVTLGLYLFVWLIENGYIQ